MGLAHALGWWRRAAGEGDGECGRVREYPPVPVWASVPTEGESGRPAGQSGCVPFLRRRGDGDQKAEEAPPSSFRRGGERRHLPTRWSAWTLDISSKKVTVARKTSRSNRVTPNHLETLPDISSKKVTVGDRPRWSADAKCYAPARSLCSGFFLFLLALSSRKKLSKRLQADRLLILSSFGGWSCHQAGQGARGMTARQERHEARQGARESRLRRWR
ncbi:uncharacterized protein LOC130705025 isoform X2 [Balaenoptera acutorostrata]|uniref:Uncharacterized protein LOC130705025 isoform X2 n=1 Tax=Balaenoptera acutorostrata TaxID=9767 RepID=A0ABM3SA47_BALAC|nr:uncharacterized protein LOC130705025 isoform X2 [Balaenoptera acutorostrata]